MEFFNSLGRLSKLLVKNTNNGEKTGDKPVAGNEG